MNTQALLKNLRRELQALKTAYAAVATTIPLKTKNLTFTTSENVCHYHSGGTDYDYAAFERIVITLDTPEGVNTIAKLEFSIDSPFVLSVKRVPYNGGARWIVTGVPNQQGGGAWAPSTYNFAVQTLVDGTLTAKMFWEV